MVQVQVVLIHMPHALPGQQRGACWGAVMIVVVVVDDGGGDVSARTGLWGGGV
jgi:hypothetical protein